MVRIPSRIARTSSASPVKKPKAAKATSSAQSKKKFKVEKVQVWRKKTNAAGKRNGTILKITYTTPRASQPRYLKLDRPDKARPYKHWVRGTVTMRGGNRAIQHYSFWGRKIK